MTNRSEMTKKTLPPKATANIVSKTRVDLGKIRAIYTILNVMKFALSLVLMDTIHLGKLSLNSDHGTLIQR